MVIDTSAILIGQGGTLANLRGYIESRGGVVLGAGQSHECWFHGE